MTYIWGHRGASGYAPENTLESFKMAAEMSADGIELDVQLTKDQQVVVCHDETIDRTSDHQGYIKDFTLEQLKTFNFNNHMEGYPFCNIPTLQEVLALIKPTNLVINIELKTAVFEYPTIEEKVVALVDQYEMKDRIIYSSFNHYSVLRIQKLVPDAYCGFLHADRFINMASYAKSFGVKALHPALYFLTDPNYVKEAKENGLLINCWTINEPEHIAGAIQLGINSCITNYPDRALSIRAKLGK